jgi:hypothetical protein
MKKDAPVGAYVRENVLNPPVPAQLNLNNALEDVLVLKYIFKEGTVFNDVQRLDNSIMTVPNKWIIFPVEKQPKVDI